MKKCCTCKAIKELSEFYQRRSGGKQDRCKDCDKKKAKDWRNANKAVAYARTRAWVKANPRWKKNQRLKRYGITLDQFEGMVLAQNGACAICTKLIVGEPQVDHCHRSKKVRGLLCIPCNLGIGHLQEDPEIMRRAIEYISH